MIPVDLEVVDGLVSRRLLAGAVVAPAPVVDLQRFSNLASLCLGNTVMPVFYLHVGPQLQEEHRVEEGGEGAPCRPEVVPLEVDDCDWDDEEAADVDDLQQEAEALPDPFLKYVPRCTKWFVKHNQDARYNSQGAAERNFWQH